MCEDFKVKLNSILKDLPTNWNALMLGGTDHPQSKPINYNDFLFKCTYTTGAFAILIDSSIFDFLIYELEKEKKLVDIYYAESMRKFNWYRTKQKLVLHPKGYSEIKAKFVDYQNLY